MIGHAGHVEVEGTMGQLPSGKMLLVQTVEDVADLVVANPDKLAYVSQTTLSVDETADIIAALNARFRLSTIRTRKTFATPPPIAKRR